MYMQKKKQIDSFYFLCFVYEAYVLYKCEYPVANYSLELFI